MRKRNLAATCPECFAPKLFNGVCQACGLEPALPVLLVEIRADSQSPTNHIHAGNLLGSELDYKAVGFTSNGDIVKRWIDSSIESPLVRAVKSDVLEELKAIYPDEKVSDEAGRLVIKEVVEFRAKYSRLVTTKYARAQLTENVLNRLRLLHPQLRVITPLQGNGHE